MKHDGSIIQGRFLLHKIGTNLFKIENGDGFPRILLIGYFSSFDRLYRKCKKWLLNVSLDPLINLLLSSLRGSQESIRKYLARHVSIIYQNSSKSVSSFPHFYQLQEEPGIYLPPPFMHYVEKFNRRS